MTSTMRPVAPIPMSISEAARACLALPAIDAPIYPAVEDSAAWLAMIEQRNQSIAQRFTDDGLAVTGTRREVAGVDTYVLRPEGVLDADTAPIYLDLHGGGLIFGAGDLTRVWGSMTASRHRMITWRPDYRTPSSHPYPAAVDDSLAVSIGHCSRSAAQPASSWAGRRPGEPGGRAAAARSRRRTADARGVGPAHPDGRPDRVRRHLPHVGRRARSAWPAPREPPLRQRPRPHRALPVTPVRRPDRIPAHLLVVRHARSVLVQHRADAPQAAGRRRRNRAPCLEAMPHGGFNGSTPEDAELDEAINSFLDKHRRARHPTPAAPTDANKLVARRFFDQRWNHHNADIIDELLGEGMNIAAEKAHLEATHAAFSDLHVTIDDLMAENDEVVVRWTATGRPEGEPPGSGPSQPTITFRGLARLRIRDGKIVDLEGFSDLAETLGASWIGTVPTGRDRRRPLGVSVAAQAGNLVGAPTPPSPGRG